jgi:hypothetical protein
VGLAFIDGDVEGPLIRVRPTDERSQSDIFRQSTPHPPPPASNVLPDADIVRTLLVKPVHPFAAPLNGLRGNTDDS